MPISSRKRGRLKIYLGMAAGVGKTYSMLSDARGHLERGQGIVIGYGDKKIQAIKEIRGITGLGLKEAKDLVEGVPKAIKEGVPKAEADDIKKKIEEAGGQVDIK